MQLLYLDGISGYLSIIASDIDNDGYVDLISTSNSEPRWYKNINGTVRLQRQRITDILQLLFIVKAVASDIDNDGDMDLIIAVLKANKIAGTKIQMEKVHLGQK